MDDGNLPSSTGTFSSLDASLLTQPYARGFTETFPDLTTTGYQFRFRIEAINEIGLSISPIV